MPNFANFAKLPSESRQLSLSTNSLSILYKAFYQFSYSRWFLKKKHCVLGIPRKRKGQPFGCPVLLCQIFTAFFFTKQIYTSSLLFIHSCNRPSSLNRCFSLSLYLLHPAQSDNNRQIQTGVVHSRRSAPV